MCTIVYKITWVDETHLHAGLTTLNKSLQTSRETNLRLIQAINWSKNNFGEIHICQGLDWAFPSLSHYGSWSAKEQWKNSKSWSSEFYHLVSANQEIVRSVLIFWTFSAWSYDTGRPVAVEDPKSSKKWRETLGSHIDTINFTENSIKLYGNS